MLYRYLAYVWGIVTFVAMAALSAQSIAQTTVSFVLDEDSTTFNNIRIFEQQPTGVWLNVDRIAPNKFSSAPSPQSTYYNSITYKVQLIRDTSSRWPVSFDNISFLMTFEFRKNEDKALIIPINIPKRIDNRKSSQLEGMTAYADMLDKYVQAAIMYFHLKNNIGAADRVTQRSARIWLSAAYVLAKNRPGNTVPERMLLIDDELSLVVKDSFGDDEQQLYENQIKETYSLRLTDVGLFDMLLSKGECENATLLLGELRMLAIQNPEYLGMRSINSTHLEDRGRKLIEKCSDQGA